MKRQKGLFVVLEGVDGAGTTTQSEKLASAVRARGHSVVVTREPSDGPVGMLIRQALTRRLSFPDAETARSAHTLALLFAADRMDHLASQVLPALAEGKVVICDRYLLSSLAYQGLAVPMEWVERINGFAQKPDLTLFLDVGVKTAQTRRGKRGGREELFEVDQVQKKLRQQYQQAIRRRSKSERILILNGELTLEEVTREALLALERLRI